MTHALMMAHFRMENSVDIEEQWDTFYDPNNGYTKGRVIDQYVRKDLVKGE